MRSPQPAALTFRRTFHSNDSNDSNERLVVRCQGLGSLLCNAKTKVPSDRMAHLFRGKQAGIQSDLSVGISPEVFMLDEVCLPVSGSHMLFSM